MRLFSGMKHVRFLHIFNHHMWVYYSYIACVYIIHTSTSMSAVCSDTGSPVECCPNYRAVGNFCIECWPGTHGVECKEYCPPNFYGRLCSMKCDCEPCDKVTGCLNAIEPQKNKYEMFCFYHCQECWPGTHGVNCKDYCPPNFYGRLCSMKCDCEPCDKRTGCSNTNETIPKEDESPTNFALWLTLSVLASCIVTCFCILRQRMLTIKPSDLDEYGSKNQMAPLENSRSCISKTPRTIDSSQTYDTGTSYDKCQTTVSNNMTETTSRNAYGCDDSMDGAYNILKLTVSDKNEHMQFPNNSSTPLEIQKHTNVHEETSQMASSVSNIVKTKNHESKPSINREKKKHQKELLRALGEFKQGSTRDRKKLRFSFSKSTELF